MKLSSFEVPIEVDCRWCIYQFWHVNNFPLADMVQVGHAKGYLTSKFNSKTVPVLPSLNLSLIFPFHLLPSPVHPTEFRLPCHFYFELSQGGQQIRTTIRIVIVPN